MITLTLNDRENTTIQFPNYTAIESLFVKLGVKYKDIKIKDAKSLTIKGTEIGILS